MTAIMLLNGAARRQEKEEQIVLKCFIKTDKVQVELSGLNVGTRTMHVAYCGRSPSRP